MKKFFIVNEHYHDFSALQKLDADVEIIPLTKGKLNVFHTERIKSEMAAIFALHTTTSKELPQTVPQKDDVFVVICGAGILNALAVLVMQELLGQVNVAIYNHNDKGYTLRRKI